MSRRYASHAQMYEKARHFNKQEALFLSDAQSSELSGMVADAINDGTPMEDVTGVVRKQYLKKHKPHASGFFGFVFPTYWVITALIELLIRWYLSQPASDTTLVTGNVSGVGTSHGSK